MQKNKNSDEEFVVLPSLNKNEYDFKIRKLKITPEQQKNPTQIKTLLDEEKLKMVE